MPQDVQVVRKRRGEGREEPFRGRTGTPINVDEARPAQRKAFLAMQYMRILISRCCSAEEVCGTHWQYMTVQCPSHRTKSSSAPFILHFDSPPHFRVTAENKSMT